jgi:hypothetical protein
VQMRLMTHSATVILGVLLLFDDGVVKRNDVRKAMWELSLVPSLEINCDVLVSTEVDVRVSCLAILVL